MDTTWANDGLLFGTLSEADCAKGGRWTVGDLHSPEDPGYSQDIQYKTWVARENMYRPGARTFKDRCDTGKWEHVLVTHNTLIGMQKARSGEEVRRFELSRGQKATFSPAALRSWELPPNCLEARGCTLLSSSGFELAAEGLGNLQKNGFYFESWTPKTSPESLHRQLGFRIQYVEVFDGSLQCTANNQVYQLQPGEHVYIKAGIEVRFHVETPMTYGSVLYYK